MSFSDLVSKLLGAPKKAITMPTTNKTLVSNKTGPLKAISNNHNTSQKSPSAPKIQTGPRWKAGGFPFYMDDKGKLYVCLFKSNNPRYGGKAPQMPKGHPDSGEAPGQAAAREAMEETGIPTRLLYQNRIQVLKTQFRGETSTYTQYVYAFPLDKKFPATTNDEGMGKWYEYEYALTVVRKDQKPFLKAARAAAKKYYAEDN